MFFHLRNIYVSHSPTCGRDAEEQGLGQSRSDRRDAQDTDRLNEQTELETFG